MELYRRQKTGGEGSGLEDRGVIARGMDGGEGRVGNRKRKSDKESREGRMNEKRNP